MRAPVLKPLQLSMQGDDLSYDDETGGFESQGAAQIGDGGQGAAEHTLLGAGALLD